MQRLSTRTLRGALALSTLLALPLTAPAMAADKVSTVVNITQIFSSLDPAKVTDYTGYMAVVNLYDGLTTVNAAGEIVPHLADSWEVSEDGLTYTFHLHPGVTFQDGKPLGASDVVYTVQRMLAINKGPSHLIAGLVQPGNVTAPDAATVVIKLDKPFSPFLSITPLILVLNESQVRAGSTEAWGEDFVGDNSVGSGPYHLVSYNRSADMVIERNADYFLGWTKGTPIDEVRFVQTSDDATVKALAQKGELGLSSSSLAADTYAAIGKMPGYKVIASNTASGFLMKMNTKVAPTDDIHVRRAIAYATDYDTIQQVIVPGGPMSGPLSPAFKGAHADGIAQPEFNLDKAREELAKSKYAGQKITLVNSYVASLAYEAEVALLMQANLEQIGITLDIRPEPWNRIVELSSKPETTPATTQVNLGPTYPSPDSMFYGQYHSKAAGTWLSMEWLEDAEVDGLIDKARATTDIAAQNEIYKQVQARIVDLVPTVFMDAPVRNYAASSCLQGYEYIPMQSWDLNFWNFHWDCTAG